MRRSKEGLKPDSLKAGQFGRPAIFRRLIALRSSSLAGRKHSNDFVERPTTLLVDRSGNACLTPTLKRAPLKRVSFYVDVEIAPTPVYAEIELAPDFIHNAAREALVENEAREAMQGPRVSDKVEVNVANMRESGVHDDEAIKQYKRESREGRRERRRQAAEENGSAPAEVHRSSSDAPLEKTTNFSTPQAKGTAARPTTEAARVYRRCCKLRETPILKKITTQLTDTANLCPTTGAVKSLDLTDYWLQLPEIITLGDYLAIFPVIEILLGNCGLTDDGLRIILAGLLATKRVPGSWRETQNQTVETQGVVERVVLKNNKLGPDGEKHISLFSDACASLKHLDFSEIALSEETLNSPNRDLQRSRRSSPGIASRPTSVVSQRPAEQTRRKLSICDRLPSRSQMRGVVDGMMRCSVYRLGV